MTTVHDTEVQKGQMREYVANFAGELKGQRQRELRFMASSDEDARDLMHRQNPEGGWTLFRMEQGQKKAVCAF